MDILHNIECHPYRSLYILAQQFDPLMSLCFTNVLVLFISFIDATSKIKRTHRQTFIKHCDRQHDMPYLVWSIILE